MRRGRQTSAIVPGVQATGIATPSSPTGALGCSTTPGLTVVLFDQAYIQYYTGLQLPLERAAGRGRRRRRADRLRARVRGRAHGGGGALRPGRVSTPSTPGAEHPMIAARAVWLDGTARRRPGRLPGDPRLRGAGALRGDRARRWRRVAPFIEGAMRAQEPGRGRADPPELPLVRARPPAAPAVLASPGATEAEASLRAGLRGDARDARGARPRLRRPARLAGRRHRRLPRPDRPPLAPGRTRSRTTSASSRATCSSPRPPRRSGATTPSSSAGWSSASRPTSSAGSSATSSPPRRSRSRRSGPGVTCADVDRAVLDYFDAEGIRDLWSQHTGHGDRPAQPRGAVPGRRRPHAGRARDGLHDRARASTRRGSAASATPTPSSSPTTGSRSSPTTRATSRA